MNRTTLLLSSALALLPFAPAAFAQAKDVTIVLGEDIDLMEPCMATRSNIGRIIMENVNETLTTYDVQVRQGRDAPPRRNAGPTRATAPGASPCARASSSPTARPSTPTTSRPPSSGR